MIIDKNSSDHFDEMMNEEEDGAGKRKNIQSIVYRARVVYAVLCFFVVSYTK